MSRQAEPDERAGNQKEAESRAHRRIVAALEGDDINELAAALGQVSDPAWHAPDSYGNRQIRHGGHKETGGFWSGLRRLTAMLQSRRQT